MWAQLALFHQKLPCVSIAPFGSPVVPDVYMITGGGVGVDGRRVAERRVDRVERGGVVVPPVGPAPLSTLSQRCDRDVAADRVEHVEVVAVGDHRVAAGIVDDELQLGTGETEVERHEDRSEAGRGEHRLDERRVVEPEIADPVTGADPAVAQDDGDAVDPILQLAVGEGRALERDGAPVR